MGYPAFGKVKTIVLPGPNGVLSLAQYKEIYGIDLREFLDLSNGEDIAIKKDILDNSLILIRQDRDLGDTHPLCPVCSVHFDSPYSAGSTDAKTTLCTSYNDSESDYYGIRLFLSKDVDFELDNVKIMVKEF